MGVAIVTDVKYPDAKGVQLTGLRLADPTEWIAVCRAALQRADGRVPEAAEDLGVSRRTLFRWLDERPDIAAGVTLRGPGRPWPEKRERRRRKAG